MDAVENFYCQKINCEYKVVLIIRGFIVHRISVFCLLQICEIEMNEICNLLFVQVISCNVKSLLWLTITDSISDSMSNFLSQKKIKMKLLWHYLDGCFV